MFIKQFCQFYYTVKFNIQKFPVHLQNLLDFISMHDDC